MTDFYTQRLDKAREAKQARNPNSLPLQKPNTQDPFGTGAGDVTTLAGTPTDPSAGPELSQGKFSQMMKHYSQDEKFNTGMAEFAAAIQALKAELEGVDLPPEVMENRVTEIYNRFKTRAANELQAAQEAKRMMEQAPGNGLQGGGHGQQY